LEAGFPTLVTPQGSSQARKLYVFSATQPLRYLAFVMSRFARAETATIAFPTNGNGRSAGPEAEGIRVLGSTYRSMNLSIQSNPRQLQRGRDLADRAADIALFYESLVGDSPYSSFTVALIESDLPGGHSPGYFAALNQPLPTSQLQWRNDPAAFNGFPDFFIAHELAHPWWGQADRRGQLPRAVDQRGLRAILRRALRAASARRRGVRVGAAADAEVGARSERSGARLSRLPSRAHPRREPGVPRAGLQQGRDGAAHAAASRRRRGVLPRAAPLLLPLPLSHGRPRTLP